MSQHQMDRIRECRAVLKRVIAEMEDILGVDVALPVTMPTLQAIEAAEGILRI